MDAITEFWVIALKEAQMLFPKDPGPNLEQLLTAGAHGAKIADAINGGKTWGQFFAVEYGKPFTPDMQKTVDDERAKRSHGERSTCSN